MEPEYMSCWQIAFSADNTSLTLARRASHDSVIAAAGSDRLSGVYWTYWSTDDAPVLHTDGGDIPLPDDVAALCAYFPSKTLVMATVEVKPRG